MSPASPFLNACKLPVDRFIVRGRDPGESVSPLALLSYVVAAAGDRAPVATGVLLPLVETREPSRSSMT